MLHPDIRQRLEEAEERLSPLANRSRLSRGRQRPEEPSLVRTEFQRDRDRREISWSIYDSKPQMRIPNAEEAIIEHTKLRDYILSPAHPLGRFKAAFFRDMGYTTDNWERLEADIREQHLSLDVTTTEKTTYGLKYIISGPLTGPNGRTVVLTSVWIIPEGGTVPRFVTIYPRG